METLKNQNKENTQSNTNQCIANDYWKPFYSTFKDKEPSSFAKFCLPYLKGNTIEFGCGNCRDLNFFKQNGIDIIGVDIYSNSEGVINQKVEDYIEQNKSPEYVYTRFFFHSIGNYTKEKILDWAKEYIFIEARTDQDKPKNLFGGHKRVLINTDFLVRTLKQKNFNIIYLSEGNGYSPYKNGNQEEDPFLIRIIAKKCIHTSAT